MTPAQFDICLEFHKKLIRASIKQSTIDSAKSAMLSDDVVKKGKSKREGDNLARNLAVRYLTLMAWSNAETSTQFINIYNKNNKRNPSDSVFYATFQYMRGSIMNKAATDHKVNPQSVKVLKPRIERWNEYSKRLIQTL